MLSHLALPVAAKSSRKEKNICRAWLNYGLDAFVVGVFWQGADSFCISLHEIEKFDSEGIQQPTLTVDSVDSPRIETRGNPLKLVNAFYGMSIDRGRVGRKHPQCARRVNMRKALW